MSYWEQRKPIRRVRSVDVHSVASTAAELLDEGGLRALTVRAVARRMDVAPASLYSRVTSVDDLFDLALDHTLGCDPAWHDAVEHAELHVLLLAYYRHLVRHPWACQVIAMRPPRGPHYLRLSERMCVLLAESGSSDPLSEVYALSNFVIGSAATTSVVSDERRSTVDSELAPLYASLHAQHGVSAETIVTEGLHALLQR
ncbi:MAG TPA: TetR/AcrR family transcriptional regulator [Candidatus Microbacterium pullistercoris]|nr:TetR/AcrR family transcriptional regulator [Candidatus Microbacterium pullistercoris]